MAEADDKMKNPYEDYEAHPDEVRVSPVFAWCALAVFLLLVTVPPVWRNAYGIFGGEGKSLPAVELFRFDPEQDDSLYRHLRTVEGEFEDAAFTDPPRRALQSAFTTLFREGNRRTVIGRDGWLFFRPAIDSLAGYGPLKSEPDTVAKDPTRESWEGPLGAITRFAAQLESYGVELILMPIPVKPMIYPEYLGGGERSEPLRHGDAAGFYEKLRAANIQVLDLADDLFAMKGETPVFLKQDTHWTPAAMRASAAWLAEFLKERPWFADAGSTAGIVAGESRDITAAGDLVDKLDLLKGSRAFEAETAGGITQVLGADGEPLSIYDEASPVVLLGDSFTNIYSMKDLGWGENSGFAQHLSRELGLSLDTIAQNGQASTGVRRTLASRPNAAAAMQRKKAVVWAIAARDLFLSETPARDSQVAWEDVEFSTSEPDIEWPVKLRARLAMKSAFADPKDPSVNYADAIYACDYEVLEVLEGVYPEKAALVFHWAFRNRELQPSAGYEVGDVHTLVLRPLSDNKALATVFKANDSTLEFEMDLTYTWADEVAGGSGAGPAGAPAGSESSASSAARSALLASAAYALVLVAIVAGIARRRLRLSERPAV